MKKILVALFVLLISFSVFATETFTIEALKPEISFRGSGLSYSLFENQAVLADNVGFNIEIPSVSVSLFNLANVMTTESGKTALSELFKSGDFTDHLTALATCFVDNAGGGKNALAEVNAGTAFSVNSFASGFNAGIKIPTAGESAGINAVAEGQASVTLAYGMSVYNDGKTRIRAGAALRPTYLIYSDVLSAGTIAGILGKDGASVSAETALKEIKFNSGLGLPFDISVSVVKFDGRLEINAQAFNLNGYYLVNKGFTIDEIKENIIPKSGYSIVKIPMQLNLSVVYQPKLKYVKPAITLGFNNINAFISDQLLADKTSTSKLQNTLMYIDADVSVNLFDIADIKAGVHGGYLYSALSLGLSGNKLDVVYYWSEFGEDLGEKGVDTLILRVRFGF